MHIDGTGPPDDPIDDRALGEPLPAAAGAGPEHDLGGVLSVRELHERPGDVGAGELPELAPELAQEPAVFFEQPGGCSAVRGRLCVST
jgi:hypothetical protein